MAEETLPNGEEQLVSIKLGFLGVPDYNLFQVTPDEIILGESILTPGLQTSVSVFSYIHSLPPKNLDLFKNSDMSIELQRDILGYFELPTSMSIKQTTYRIDNRKLMNNNIEQFTIHACDQSLLNDAGTLVSKMWSCKTPSHITNYVLRTCAGVKNLDVEESKPARDYRAENIHPFQVVSQQAQAALDPEDEPSFVHYMTYENGGTHHFRSLYSLCRQSPVMNFKFAEVGAKNGYGNPYTIMTLSFPCDFDLLSDILNGVGTDGKKLNTLLTFNPITKSTNLFGVNVNGCGIGAGVVKLALSNMDSAKQQNACPDYTNLYIQRRQARMSLLEKDKIALRLTVPWNPKLNAGKVISIDWINKEKEDEKVYGSGTYLIASLSHNIKFGGFSTITMDCVSTTVGQGIV